MKSPNQLVWERLRRNRTAMISGSGLLGLIIVSVLGYFISPDASPNANRQALELAKKPPLSRFQFLVTPKSNPPAKVNLIQFWLGGQPDEADYIPVESAKIQGDTLYYTRLGGLKGFALSNEAKVENRTFWLGTDAAGRDILSRLILGGRASLGVGFLALALSLVLGVGFGAVAGLFGGAADGAIQWFMTVLWSVPSLLLAVAISFALGKGFQALCIAIGLSVWVDLARLVRGQTLVLRNLTYMEAARALALPLWRVVFLHLTPNLAGVILIQACANLSTAVMLEAGLSFLGMGVQAPMPSWGGMIYEGYTHIVLETGKWLAIFPGAVMLLFVVCLNLFASGLRDALAK